MLESSGFRKYSTLLVIQLFSWRLCLCHCLCIRLCLCICVPYSFLNSYYHKHSENVWVWGPGTTEQPRKDRATHPVDNGRLRWAIFTSLFSILLDSLKLMTNSIPLFSLTCECSKIFAALKICRGCREPEQWPDWPNQTTPGPLSYETSSCSGNFQVGVCLGLKTFDLNYQKRQKIEMKCFESKSLRCASIS